VSTDREPGADKYEQRDPLAGVGNRLPASSTTNIAVPIWPAVTISPC